MNKIIWICFIYFYISENIYAQNADFINGHKFIDLALPSGTLWASCNVGANNSDSRGIFVSWGETKSKEITNYNWLNYKHANSILQKTPQRVTTLTPTSYKIRYKKYCFEPSKGVADKKQFLDDIDDAAMVNWGDSWCMPTPEQFVELKEHCEWEIGLENGRVCHIGTGHNGNKIFFPLSGIISTYIDEVQSRYLYNNDKAIYWTNTCYSTENGVSMQFDSRGDLSIYSYQKYEGGNVRPVLTKKATDEINAMTPNPLLQIFNDINSRERMGITDMTPFDVSPYFWYTYSGSKEMNLKALKDEMDKKYKHPKYSEEMRKSAENGNLEAKFLLGYCTYAGLGISKNYYKAQDYLEDAAKSGSKKALVMLFSLGMADTNLRSSWMQMLEKAMNENYPPATIVFTLLRYSADLERSRHPEIILKEKMNIPEDQYGIKNLYPEISNLYGSMTENEFFLQSAATKGHPYAALNLSYIYCDRKKYELGYKYAKIAKEYGIIVPQLFMETLEINSKTSSTNCSDIINGMVQAFESNRFKDVEAAYKKAKEKGVESDDLELCMALILRQRGGDYENSIALNLLKRCAENGSVFAQEQLAITYEKGIGLPNIDMGNAIIWYRKAAQSGSKKSQNFLSGRNLKW